MPRFFSPTALLRNLTLLSVFRHEKAYRSSMTGDPDQRAAQPAGRAGHPAPRTAFKERAQIV